jgi:hypothetical protein
MLGSASCQARIFTGVTQVKGQFGAWRVKLTVLSTVFALAGCNGFPEPEPIRAAERKPEKYPTYSMGAATAVIAVGGQQWLVLPGAVAQVPSDMLVPAGQSSLLALKWDQAPFSAMFQREPSGRLLEAGEIR